MNKLNSINLLELRANCGFPGKPYRSKIIPEEKSIYEEGETVSFQCSDYWSPPQMRKCVNGVWVGPPARCGDFIYNVSLNDVKLLDMSFGLPIEKFHYRNINLTNSDKPNLPNSFLSHRYPQHRLRITNDHEFMWKLNFTKPAVKLFVRVNFNFINFTILDQAIRNNFSFYIDVEISPYRTCNLDYQNNNVWRDNGNRIDSYFICEAHSYQDLERDIDDPNNYMIMRTKSSHNLPYELVAIYFGTVYGNEKEPVCGEPETDFGQIYRVRHEYRDYIIDCLDNQWKDVSSNQLKQQFVNHQKCIGDMIWNGTKPRCIPVRNCPIQKILNNNNNHRRHNHHFNNNNENDHNENNSLIVEAILHYYNFIDNQTIYAIDGTEIVYACSSNDYILIGKDTRTCKRDMTWSGIEPVCKYIKATNEIVESPNYLIVIIICMGILLFLILFASFLLLLFYTKHLKLQHKNNNDNEKKCSDQHQNNLDDDTNWQNENYYDNIEMNFNNQQQQQQQHQSTINFGLLTNTNATNTTTTTTTSATGGYINITSGCKNNNNNDIFYDIYETVDSKGDNLNNLNNNNLNNNNIRYVEPNQYFFGMEHNCHHFNHQNNRRHFNSNNNNQKENDYIKMYGSSLKVDELNDNPITTLPLPLTTTPTPATTSSQTSSTTTTTTTSTSINNSSPTLLLPSQTSTASTTITASQQQQPQPQQHRHSSSTSSLSLSSTKQQQFKNREPSYLEVMQ